MPGSRETSRPVLRARSVVQSFEIALFYEIGGNLGVNGPSTSSCVIVYSTSAGSLRVEVSSFCHVASSSSAVAGRPFTCWNALTARCKLTLPGRRSHLGEPGAIEHDLCGDNRRQLAPELR